MAAAEIIPSSIANLNNGLAPSRLRTLFLRRAVGCCQQQETVRLYCANQCQLLVALKAVFYTLFERVALRSCAYMTLGTDPADKKYVARRRRSTITTSPHSLVGSRKSSFKLHDLHLASRRGLFFRISAFVVALLVSSKFMISYIESFNAQYFCLPCVS